MSIVRPAGSCAAAVLLLAACATPAPRSETTPPAAAEPAPPATPAEASSEEVAEGTPEGAFGGCAAKLDEGPTRERSIAGRKAQQTGARLRFTEPDADGKLVVGVLGPINENSGLNLLALRRYVAFFTEQGADAIVVTGDVGETPASLAQILGELTAAEVPVMVISGNRECGEDFAQGVRLAQQRSDAVVNLNAIRSATLGGVTFVSLPGYHDPNFIPCETGCRYDQRTLDEVVTAAQEAGTPVVLVSHGPPLGAGRGALDYAVNGKNVGDPQVNRALRDGKIAFGFFSNIKEAGARATAADHKTPVAEGKPAKALYLNPGPADISRWEMNDGTWGNGFAATATFTADGAASWRLYRGAKPTAEDKKAAKALEQAATGANP